MVWPCQREWWQTDSPDYNETGTLPEQKEENDLKKNHGEKKLWPEVSRTQMISDIKVEGNEQKNCNLTVATHAVNR